MKKTIFFSLLLAIVGMIGMNSCNGCSKNEKKAPAKECVKNFTADYDGVLPDLSEGAEHIIAVQRQEMFSLLGGGNYVWYETKFSFADSLKDESLNDDALVEVTSVFQTFHPELCYMITTNVSKGTLIPAPTPGLWIEDCDLSGAEIKLNIKDVIEQLKTWNGVLPPAKSIILRKPVGPQDCNAQYVVGNPYEVIFVDAVSGDITDWNPAFPR